MSGRCELKKFPKKLEELRQYALEVGADRAIILSAKQLEIRHSARAKCYIPACKFYGSSIMCPPHNPLTPDITQDIVAEYRYGILFQVEARVEDFVGREWRRRHIPTELKHKEILARLEGRAFYTGFPRAMGFAAGECSLCLPQKACAVLRGDPCIHPLRARPAMEACGFDVFAIAKKVGWNLVPIGHSSDQKEVGCASLIGLVLVV
jgi:predicted metal-binding protein